jgi:DNA-binding NarL/FixJ family response regulator
MDRVRVVVLSDAPLLLLGLGTILRQDQRLAVAAEVAEVRAAVAAVRRVSCDVLMVHHTATAAATAARLAESMPDETPLPRLLLLTEQSGREELLAALRLGIPGYAVLSELTPDELCHGVVQLAQHGVWMCPVATQHLLDVAPLDRVLTRRPESSMLTTVGFPKPDLSERELAVLRQAAAGQREVQIAHDLCLSPNTVKTYLRRICDKLQTSSRADAIQVGIYLGLVADRRRDDSSRQALRAKVVS